MRLHRFEISPIKPLGGIAAEEPITTSGGTVCQSDPVLIEPIQAPG